MTGFYKSSSGKVSFYGRDITRMRADKVVSLGIARTFQIVQIISDMTVLENVMTGAMVRYARIKPAMDKAEEILDFTGLYEKKDFLRARSSPSPTRSASRSPWPWPRSPRC